jgi:lipoprotein-releasing system ATP-binding protein
VGRVATNLAVEMSPDEASWAAFRGEGVRGEGAPRLDRVGGFDYHRLPFDVGASAGEQKPFKLTERLEKPMPGMRASDASAKAGIVIEDLQKVFVHEGKVLAVLKGVNTRLERGDMVSIQGRSGAGKSTFLHILGTLDRPTNGRILFNGEDVFRYGATNLARFRNKHIGFVFQFHHLLPEFTALENVMMPALICRESKAVATKRALKLLDRVGLHERVSHKPGELSGGEQQRVALARALVMEPSLLLADEPTGNLDRATGEEIHDLFWELNKQQQITIVIVTHDPGLAERMPRQLRMANGVLLDDTRAEKHTTAGDM